MCGRLAEFAQANGGPESIEDPPVGEGVVGR